MTATPYPDRCWLTSKAEARPSAIEGQGLFATTPITTDEVVMQLGGQLIDDTTLAGLPALQQPDRRQRAASPDRPIAPGPLRQPLLRPQPLAR